MLGYEEEIEISAICGGLCKHSLSYKKWKEPALALQLLSAFMGRLPVGYSDPCSELVLQLCSSEPAFSRSTDSCCLQSELPSPLLCKTFVALPFRPFPSQLYSVNPKSVTWTGKIFYSAKSGLWHNPDYNPLGFCVCSTHSTKSLSGLKGTPFLTHVSLSTLLCPLSTLLSLLRSTPGIPSLSLLGQKVHSWMGYSLHLSRIFLPICS